MVVHKWLALVAKPLTVIRIFASSRVVVSTISLDFAVSISCIVISASCVISSVLIGLGIVIAFRIPTILIIVFCQFDPWPCRCAESVDQRICYPKHVHRLRLDGGGGRG